MKKNFYKTEHFRIFGDTAGGLLALKLYLIISDRCEEYGICDLSQGQLASLLETKNKKPSIRGVQKSLKSLRDSKLIKRMSSINARSVYVLAEDNLSAVSEEQIRKAGIGIYAIETDDGIYVGKSRDLSSRMRQHSECIKNGSHRYIKNQNFDFEILEECEERHLEYLEAKWALDFHESGMKVLNISNFIKEHK
tara:strand:- start:1274 stop:1855 length:582 start_codon:yes stop_codon:yes gene_type:complete